MLSPGGVEKNVNKCVSEGLMHVTEWYRGTPVACTKVHEIPGTSAIRQTSKAAIFHRAAKRCTRKVFQIFFTPFSVL